MPALRAAPPRSLVRISGVVVVAAATMGVVGALRTGISWDEPYHVMRLANYLDHGWFALDWSVSSDQSGQAGDGETNTLVYGPVTMLLLHGLGVLIGVEGWGDVATSTAAYDVRHLGILLIGLVGTAAAAATSRIILGSWRWALVTAAALLALPMWTGHLMFNIKDVPVATGYTVMTLALVGMVAPERGRRWLRVLGLVAGIVLMVGTRPGMAAAVVAGLAVLGTGAVVAGRFGSRRAALLEAGLGLAISAGVLVAVYPNVFGRPLSLLSSAEQSASFRGGTQANPGYVPFHVVAQEPLLLLAFFVIGVIAVQRVVRNRWRSEVDEVTRITLVVVQLTALPMLAILRQSDLYNALRQLLFATPAWAVVVTLGIASALTWGAERGRPRLVAGAAGLALVTPLVAQAQLFPYQYAYYNSALDLVAGTTGVHVPSDYWRVSAPELLDRIPTDAPVVCGPTRSDQLDVLVPLPTGDPSEPTAGRFSSDSSLDCRTDPLGPLAPLWREAGLPVSTSRPHEEYYALLDRDHPVPDNCTRLAGVERERHARTITMTYVARCALAAPDLGSTPVDLSHPLGEQLDPVRWSYAPLGWVTRSGPSTIEATGTSASLTFTLREPCPRGCDLLLDASGAPEDLAASVNDRSVPSLRTSDGTVAVPIPPGATTAWVTFHRTSGDPLDLRLSSLRLAEPGTP